MTFQSAPDMASAEIKFSTLGAITENRLVFKFAGAYAQSDIDNLATAVDGAVRTYYLPIINAGYTYEETHVRGLTNIIDLESIVLGAGAVGGVGSFPLPPNVSFVVTLRTGHTGRSARGRFYALGMSTAQLLSFEQVTSAYQTAIIAVVHNIQLAAAAQGWTMVVLSRRTAGVVRAVGVGTPITLVSVTNDLLDSQRGRLPHGH